MDSKLKQEEQRIDLKVLHHLNRDDHRKKLKRFRRTVSAVHAIVSNKLYRSKASSLEAYFREAWKISRAQVYRFLDCAWVLKHLEGYQSQPCRERLCRSLKRLAKNRSDIRKLWETVLEKVDNDHEAVTSTIIATIWTELLERGQVTGKPDPVGDEAAGGLSDRERADLDDDDSDSEPEQQKNVPGFNDGAQVGGSLDMPAGNFSTPAPMPIKESAPLTLEPALDRAAADSTASLLDSIHQQAAANLFRSANSAQSFQQSSNLTERTLPKPSTLTDSQLNNSTSFSWRKTTLAPTLLDAGVPAPLNRAFSLPMLRDLPRAPQHAKWPTASVPPTQSHDATVGQSAVPSSSHMVIPHTRPMWTAPALAPAHPTGTNGSAPMPMPNATLPQQHIQHVEIPSTDVNTCADLLDSFSRKGYALQPYVHGRWVEEPASQWRIAPIDPRFRRTTLLYVPSMTTGPPTTLGTMLAQTVDAAGKLGNGMGQSQTQMHAPRGQQDLHQQPTQYVYITAPPNGNPAFTMQQHPPPIYNASPAPPQYSPQYEYERILTLQGRYGNQATTVGAGGGMYTVQTLPTTSPTLPTLHAQNRDHTVTQQQQGLPVMQTSPPLKPTAGTFALQPWGVAQQASAPADHGHHRAYSSLPLPSHVQGQQATEQGDASYGVELGSAGGSAW